MLMVGDPSLGKSQILKAACEISTIAVKTVGYSTTTSGLAVNSYNDEGTKCLESGALMRANYGVCCIDEINLIDKIHFGVLHEAMESQKVTISKGE
jgi:DNA replicative helicase MCM subunit Mcm2 (Cdc46/Mcm family)